MQVLIRADFRFASKTEVAVLKCQFRYTPDSVAKVVLPKVSKILRAAGAFFV